MSATACTEGKGHTEGGDDTGGTDGEGGTGGGTTDLTDYLEPDPDGVEGGLARCIAEAEAKAEESFEVDDPTTFLVYHDYHTSDKSSGFESGVCTLLMVHPDYPEDILYVLLSSTSADITIRSIKKFSCEVDSVAEYEASAPTGLRIDSPDLASISLTASFPGYEVVPSSIYVVSATFVTKGCFGFDAFAEMVPSSFDSHHPVVEVGVELYVEGKEVAWGFVGVDGRSGDILGTYVDE